MKSWKLGVCELFLIFFAVLTVAFIAVLGIAINNKSVISIGGKDIMGVSAGLMAVAATFIVCWQIISYFSIQDKFEELRKEKDSLEEKIKQIEGDRDRFNDTVGKVDQKLEETIKTQKVTEYYSHYSIAISHFGFKEYMRSFRAFNCALFRALELNDNRGQSQKSVDRQYLKVG